MRGDGPFTHDSGWIELPRASRLARLLSWLRARFNGGVDPRNLVYREHATSIPAVDEVRLASPPEFAVCLSPDDAGEVKSRLASLGQHGRAAAERGSSER